MSFQNTMVGSGFWSQKSDTNSIFFDGYCSNIKLRLSAQLWFYKACTSVCVCIYVQNEIRNFTNEKSQNSKANTFQCYQKSSS